MRRAAFVVCALLTYFVSSSGTTVRVFPGVLVIALPYCETKCAVDMGLPNKRMYTYRETVFESSGATQYAAIRTVRPVTLNLKVRGADKDLNAWSERGRWLPVRSLEKFRLDWPNQQIDRVHFNTTANAQLSVLTRGIDATVVIDGKPRLYSPGLLKIPIERGEHLVEWRWTKARSKRIIDPTRGDGYEEAFQIAAWVDETLTNYVDETFYSVSGEAFKTYYEVLDEAYKSNGAYDGALDVKINRVIWGVPKNTVVI